MEIRSVAQFLDYWDSFRGRTRRVIDCIPPARIEWTHQPGKFTLGDLVRHLATIERYMYAETVSGRASVPGSDGLPSGHLHGCRLSLPGASLAQAKLRIRKAPEGVA